MYLESNSGRACIALTIRLTCVRLVWLAAHWLKVMYQLPWKPLVEALMKELPSTVSQALYVVARKCGEGGMNQFMKELPSTASQALIQERVEGGGRGINGSYDALIQERVERDEGDKWFYDAVMDIPGAQTEMGMDGRGLADVGQTGARRLLPVFQAVPPSMHTWSLSN